MRDILVAMIIFGSLPAILYRPFWGIVMWCWISYMVPHRMAWGFITHFPVAATIGIVTIIAYVVSREPKKLPVNGITVTLMMFVLWMLVTTIASPDPAMAWEQFDKVIKIQFFTFLTLAMLTSKERLHLVLWVVTLSIAFFGTKGGIYTLLRGGEGRVYGPPGGFFAGNNEVGLAILMVIPLLLYLRTTLDRLWKKHVISIIIVLCSIAVLGTQSRGAFVAIAALGVFIWWRNPHKIRNGMIIATLAFAGFWFMPSTWHERMDTVALAYEGTYDSSMEGRFNAWGFAVNIASSNITGGSFSAFSPENFLRYAPEPTDYHDAHSIYFEVLGEHGYIGLFLFLTVFILTWRCAGKLIRRFKRDPEHGWLASLSRYLQASLVAYAAGGTFLGLAYFDLPYHILVFIVAMDVYARRLEAGVPATANRRTALGKPAVTSVLYGDRD